MRNFLVAPVLGSCVCVGVGEKTMDPGPGWKSTCKDSIYPFLFDAQNEAEGSMRLNYCQLDVFHVASMKRTRSPFAPGKIHELHQSLTKLSHKANSPSYAAPNAILNPRVHDHIARHWKYCLNPTWPPLYWPLRAPGRASRRPNAPRHPPGCSPGRVPPTAVASGSSRP